MYSRCFKRYRSYFISFSSSKDCLEVQEKKKKVAVWYFRPPHTYKKWIFTSIERELHVSALNESPSFPELVSQDFYPRPTSIRETECQFCKINLEPNDGYEVLLTASYLFFFFTGLKWLSTYCDSRLPPVCLSYVCHVFALVSGNPLARQAHSLLWFWSLLLISARADVNELPACFDVSAGETFSATAVSWVCLYSRWFCTAVAVCSRTSSDGLVRFLLFLPRSKLGNLVL